MAKIQAVWALDVGQAALKALKLVPGEGDDKDKVIAEAFDYVEYPKILSQPDADADQLVREALATFLERNDVKGCKVAIAVPGQAGLVKFIKLPPVEKKRIPDIVKFEARQQIPFALEEVIWDYQQIGGDEGEGDEDFTMAEVGLFAMKRDQVNRAILPFTVAGIEVDVVQMGPIALYNFLTYDKIPKSDKGEKGSVVLLDIGADNTDLIISDGTRIWQRNVPIGGNHFTRALTKELKLTFAKGEHLKRNATKAPDPRAVFTAMRSVFNDLASEINRSIGFYSSVNRTAKIIKVLGMGNGFKLPGLQKFLQQNLNHDVEKLESFSHLTGDDVVGAPQFQENLPSFAVAYGLALQGLGASQIRTNLLPPEMEQVRMIRRKKPWALAASVVLMLGFSALFVGDWKVWAKVHNPTLLDAANQAKTVASQGATLKSEYEAAKGEWNGKKAVGDSLVIDPSDQARWPSLLRTLNAYIYNPFRDAAIKPPLDSNKAEDSPKIDKLRVHVDGIVPRYREDLASGWFDTLPESAKRFMHPADRTAPSGPGWVIQIIAHHYNPYPARGGKALDPLDFGPLNFIVQKVMPPLLNPNLRRFGISHATLAWFERDPNWTTDKELASNGMPQNVPLLPKATPKATGEGGAAGGDGGFASGGGAAMPGGMPGSYMSRGGGGMTSGGSSGGMGFASGGGGGAMMPGSYMSGGAFPGAMGGNADAEKNITRLTRTDFVIQLVWRPLGPTDQPKSVQDIAAELQKAQDATKGAIQAPPSEDALEAASKQASQAAQKQMEAAIKAQEKPQTKGSAAGTAAPASGTPPAAAAAPAGNVAPGAASGATPPAAAPAAPPAAGAPAAK